jgi:glycosyltransferase involved in cell wall biosynthesis
MKITIVLPAYYNQPIGGYHVHYRYANLLVERGHAVTLVFPHRIEPSRGLRPALSAARWALQTRMYNRPLIGTFALDARVGVALVRDLSARSMPDADVLIATSWLTAEQLQNSPVSKGQRFYILYDYEYWKTATAPIRQRIEATFQVGYRIVATSSAVRSMLATSGVSPATQIICGINFEDFGMDCDPAARERWTMGFPSRIEPFKGTRDAIAAALILKSKYGDRLQVTTFGRKAGDLPNGIDWLPSPTQQQLRNFYNDIAVFMLPSHFEGWGLPGVEAMACGAALVVTDNGGSSDYAFDDVTALVVAPGDVEGLAAAAERLLVDRFLRLRLAEEGRRFVQRFDWDSAGDALENLLQS